MADLILNVVPTQQFVFTPNSLVIRVISTDIGNGTASVYFELTDTNLDNSRYNSREWVDRGNVTVPLALLAAVRDNEGNIDPVVVNQFLTAFHLQTV